MIERLSIELRGHLSRDNLEESLAPLTEALERGKGYTLLVDCRQMTGYDPAARDLFVEWNGRWRSSIRRVAIVTERRLWSMVITAMALASRQSMRAFSNPSDASEWLMTLERKA